MTAASLTPVAPADAVGELSASCPGPLAAALIDLVQSGDISAVRDAEGILRYGITPAGEQRARELAGQLRNHGRQPR